VATFYRVEIPVDGRVDLEIPTGRTWTIRGIGFQMTTEGVYSLELARTGGAPVFFREEPTPAQVAESWTVSMNAGVTDHDMPSSSALIRGIADLPLPSGSTIIFQAEGCEEVTFLIED